ncbi:hypothetical protein AR158_c359R [Paramecium bursaria Chlorella virus AR158]|uniref:hypothetical protein n=1 Tax=Paramecium bursaria Chlorella virus AR158 TaxID=380598 RepID=UPI00015AA94E|nr:hypothetical protein AR158_c359R [Paramecium bursaria Chlorella virus AR158]ABU43904.1 hypothetical protein AR158_c359R [Paramecium bursaria Chlorella virus AR158]
MTWSAPKTFRDIIRHYIFQIFYFVIIGKRIRIQCFIYRISVSDNYMFLVNPSVDTKTIRNPLFLNLMNISYESVIF